MKNFITASCVFLLLLCFYESPHSQELNFPLDTIVKDGFYNYRSLVKYDESGFLHIVNTTMFDIQSSTREIFYRNNKTGAFVTRQITNNSVDDNYATMDFDRNGNVHIGWERRDASNNFQVIYSNNRNDSGTFIEPVWITTGGANKATPFMCVGKKDSLVHFVYYTYVSSVTDYVYYRNYNYVTGVLSQEYQLGPAEAGGENDVECVADTNGVVHIVYVTNSPLSSSALKYYTFSNGVLTPQITNLNAYIEYPEICLNRYTNSVHVIYRYYSDKRIYLLTRNPDGSFSAPYAITMAGLGNPSYWRGFCADPGGRIYLTYQNSVSPAPKGFFLVHGLPGESFSQPLLIWQDSINYIARGSSSVTAKGNYQIAIAFDPAASRNGNVVSDIFLKKGTLTPTSLSETETRISDFKLYQNFPNPFNPSTRISFSLYAKSNVKLSILDILGREIRVLLNGNLQNGDYSFDYHADNISSGVYFYKIETETGSKIRSMIYLK